MALSGCSVSVRSNWRRLSGNSLRLQRLAAQVKGNSRPWVAACPVRGPAVGIRFLAGALQGAVRAHGQLGLSDSLMPVR